MGEGEGTTEDSYTTSQLAKRYKVAPNSVKNWEQNGQIPPADRTPGGHRRYTQVHIDALDTFFNKSKVTPGGHRTDIERRKFIPPTAAQPIKAPEAPEASDAAQSR
jgi:hypothetical protein